MADRRNFSYPVVSEAKKSPPINKPSAPGPSGSIGPSGASRSDFTRFEKESKPENQHQFLTALVGQQVKLCFTTGEKLEGELAWHDNFNICVKTGDVDRMIFKGALLSIEGKEKR